MIVGLTSEEEVAEIIFNSIDPVLNDMIRKAEGRNYEIGHLVLRISADINTHYEPYLMNRATALDRKKYLFQRIMGELSYYAGSDSGRTE